MTTAVHRWSDPPIDFDGRVALKTWVESLPLFEGRRPAMTCNGYLNLLRHMLAGDEVPFYTNPADLLVDALSAHTTETSRLRNKLEIAEMTAARNEPAVQRLWTLVFATGKRKTMRTDEVRAALEAAS